MPRTRRTQWIVVLCLSVVATLLTSTPSASATATNSAPAVTTTQDSWQGFFSVMPGDQIFGSFHITAVGFSHVQLSGCGEWDMSMGENEWGYLTINTSTCTPGDQTLTATWSYPGGPNLRSIPVHVAAPGEMAIGRYREQLLPGPIEQFITGSTPSTVTPATWTYRCDGSADADYTVTAYDAGGTRVWGTSTPASCSDQILAPTTWNGSADGETLVADGTYSVVAQVRDRASGRTASDQTSVVVDGRNPAPLRDPSSVSRVTTAVTLTWDAAPGLTVDRISASLPGCGLWYASPPTGGDGAWTVPAADATPCAPGAQTLAWTVVWHDAAQRSNTFVGSQPVEVVDVTPPRLTYVFNGTTPDLYPVHPGGPVSTTWSYTCVDGSPVQLAVAARDRQGKVVRRFSPVLATHCSGDDTEPIARLAWDGTDDAGQALPDASYTVVAIATDAVGQRTTVRIPFVIDHSAPVVLSGSVAGGALTRDTSLTWTPRPGVTIKSVFVAVKSRCAKFASLTPGADGRVVFTGADVGVPACLDGDVYLSWDIEYTDARGGGGFYTDDDVLFHNPDTTAPVISPSSLQNTTRVSRDGQGNVQPARWYRECRDGSSVSLTTTVRSSAGRVVRTMSDGPQWTQDLYNGRMTLLEPTWDGTTDAGRPAHDGWYQVTFVVTDAGGLSTTRTVKVQVIG